MNWSLRTIVSLVAILGIGGSAAADDCEVFTKILNASRTGFAALQGPYDAELEQFTSLVALPGASQCYIEGEPYPYYTCEWSYDGSQRKLVESALADLVSSVSACIPQKLLSSVKKMPDSDTRSSSLTRFTFKNHQTIGVRYLFHQNKRHPEQTSYLLLMQMDSE